MAKLDVSRKIIFRLRFAFDELLFFVNMYLQLTHLKNHTNNVQITSNHPFSEIVYLHLKSIHIEL